ncbi:MAG TPA: cytochrome c [Allosphingosinicella sp.]|jgi:cytochrome c556
MRLAFAFAALTPLALTSCATTPPADAEAASRAPSPAEVVAARQAAFNLTAATFGSMRGAVESGGDVKPLAFGARGLNRWGHAIPSMFPAGTQLPGSRALPTVWTDRAGFEVQAAMFQAATAKLVAAAQSGDSAAFGAAYKEVGGTCGSCHSTYRGSEAK